MRDSAFSNYGHHGKKYSNDPSMWPDKYRKSKEELDKLKIIYVAPGTREAMKLHESDVSLKAIKLAKRAKRAQSVARSSSVRARSSSVASSVTRTKSHKEPSTLAQTNKAKLMAYVEDPSRSKFELMRVLHLGRQRKIDLPPAGPWTAKSRPPSLLPDQLKARKLSMRKKLQTLSRKSKTLKGKAKTDAKAAKAKQSA